MFEQALKNIDDVLWKEAGCTTELDYTEQTSWLLFLKYLDGLRFRSQTEKHELSHLYEAKIKNMGNAGRKKTDRSSSGSSALVWSNASTGCLSCLRHPHQVLSR